MYSSLLLAGLQCNGPPEPRAYDAAFEPVWRSGIRFTQNHRANIRLRASVDTAALRRHSARLMAHIHEKIDFTAAIFVVQHGRVLLVHHRKLNKWLPLGGHIELDEDPEAAAMREAREESGFDVELIGERPPTTGKGTRALIAPRFLDIHRISDTHEHIGMIYWARPRNGTMTLAQAEHHDIRWCNWAELRELDPRIDDAVRWYCEKAIEEITDNPVS